MLDNIEAIIAIIVIDLVLSGDNAVVIGMAARRLTPENRRRAILFGGGGAVALRIGFTALAATLLGIPYLRLIGGVLLLWIAWKLVRPGDEHGSTVNSAESLGEAVRTIILADVVMSLDNILAVGGAAHGDIWLLLFGLLVSIPILLLGSELVARVLGRAPALVYVGVLVLIHTAVSMIVEDGAVHDRLPEFVRSAADSGRLVWLVAVVVTGLLALAAVSRDRAALAVRPAGIPAEPSRNGAASDPELDRIGVSEPSETSADAARSR